MPCYFLIIFFAGCLICIPVDGKAGYTPSYSSNEEYDENAKDLIYDNYEDHDETMEIPFSSTTVNALDCDVTGASFCPITNFTFTFIKSILNVTFTPSCTGQKYSVTVQTSGSETLHRFLKDVYFAMAVSSVTFDIHDYVPYHYHNITISSSLCSKSVFTSEAFLLDGYKTDSIDCMSWNVKLGGFRDPQLYAINIEIELSPKYKLCFEDYSVRLHKFDVECHWKDIVSSTAMKVHNSNVATFEELPLGNYCISLTAQHEDCIETNCGTRQYNKIIEVYEPQDENLLPVKKTNEEHLLIIGLCMSVFVVVLICVLIGARKLRNKSIYQTANVESLPQKESSGNTAGRKEKMVVCILYAQCARHQQKVAEALYNFLKECCNIHPILADNDPNFFVGSAAWVQTYFTYKDLLNGSSRPKILILETDAAVRLYEHWKKHKVMLSYQEYSPQNGTF